MKLTRVFEKLLALYEEPTRWTKGAFVESIKGSRRQCYCLVGGLAKVQGANPLTGGSVKGHRELLEAINRHKTGKGYGTIITWNDRRERTLGQVRQVVRDALRHAKRAEARAA